MKAYSNFIQNKAELSRQLNTIEPPTPSALTALASALAIQTGKHIETTRHTIALIVAVLLEGLCLLFGFANFNQPNTPKIEGKTTVKTVTKKEQQEVNEIDEQFTTLVAAIRSKELKPTYANIRSFMNIGAGQKVKDIRTRLLKEGVVLEGAGGSLVAAF